MKHTENDEWIGRENEARNSVERKTIYLGGIHNPRWLYVDTFIAFAKDPHPLCSRWHFPNLLHGIVFWKDIKEGFWWQETKDIDRPKHTISFDQAEPDSMEKHGWRANKKWRTWAERYSLVPANRSRPSHGWTRVAVISAKTTSANAASANP